MASLMVGSSYGEAKVRFLLARRPSAPAAPHALREVVASVELAGDFARSFVAGENAPLIPTDTIKNVILHFAKTAHNEQVATSGAAATRAPWPSVGPSLEVFAMRLGADFIARYAQVSTVTVRLEEAAMRRAHFGGEQGDALACFEPVASREQRFVEAVVCRGGSTQVRAGFTGLRLVRTLPAAFARFAKDALTTVRDSEDVGVVDVRLDVAYDFYANPAVDDNALDYERGIAGSVRHAAVKTFATLFPMQSVQQALLAVSKACLAAAEEIKEVLATVEFSIHRPLAPSADINNSNSGVQLLVPVDGPRAVAKSRVKRTHVEIPHPFVWGPAFDCGHDTINRQHSALFDLIRRLDADRTNGALLAEIMAHAAEHFRDEEAIFAAEGFPQLKHDAHARVHQRFTTQAAEATKGFGTRERPMNDQQILFLKKWLVEHIMGSDMGFATFLAEKRKKDVLKRAAGAAAASKL